MDITWNNTQLLNNSVLRTVSNMGYSVLCNSTIMNSTVQWTGPMGAYTLNGITYGANQTGGRLLINSDDYDPGVYSCVVKGLTLFLGIYGDFYGKDSLTYFSREEGVDGGY